MKKFFLGLIVGLVASFIPVAFANIAVHVPFTDVNDGDWYYDYANGLKSIGIIDGYSDNTFRGNNLVNRAELSKFIYMTYEKLTSKWDFQLLEDKYEALNAKVSTLDFPGDCYFNNKWYQEGDSVDGSGGFGPKCLKDGRMLAPSAY